MIHSIFCFIHFLFILERKKNSGPYPNFFLSIFLSTLFLLFWQTTYFVFFLHFFIYHFLSLYFFPPTNIVYNIIQHKTRCKLLPRVCTSNSVQPCCTLIYKQAISASALYRYSKSNNAVVSYEKLFRKMFLLYYLISQPYV